MILRASRFLPGLALATALFAACAQGELKGGGGGGDECDRRAECDEGQTCAAGKCVPEGNQQGAGGGTPYDYDACCSPSSDPGCGAPNIEICVCAFDDYCCTSAWDAECVTRAMACGACAGDTGAGTGSGVGATTTGATSGAGVGSSTSGATSGVGPSAVSSSSSSGGGGGDCCVDSGFPGCIDPAIESCVCGADPFCCSTAWDSACVSGATACGGCGGSAVSSSSSGGGSSACCLTSSLPGCSDAPIESCVCNLDPYCCDTEWDSQCASEAQNDCGAVCF